MSLNSSRNKLIVVLKIRCYRPTIVFVCTTTTRFIYCHCTTGLCKEMQFEVQFC